jgi:DNA polymerase III delta prime subunit
MKFVILDEVDYMTKNAQQALRYLLQNYSNTARFCLICNYISKIDEGLQNEFLRLRFNQLPNNDIILFLKNIAKSEKININEKSIECIQKLYKSDIRSMINFIQSNQSNFKNVTLNNDLNINIIDDNVWESLTNKIIEKTSLNILVSEIHNISIKYNIDKKNIIKDYLNYIIRNKSNIITSEFLGFVENLMHSQESNNQIFVNYSLSRLSTFICNGV